MTDSGNIYDSTLKGGSLGAYVFSQQNVIWSNLQAECLGMFFAELFTFIPPPPPPGILKKMFQCGPR